MICREKTSFTCTVVTKELNIYFVSREHLNF